MPNKGMPARGCSTSLRSEGQPGPQCRPLSCLPLPRCTPHSVPLSPGPDLTHPPLLMLLPSFSTPFEFSHSSSFPHPQSLLSVFLTLSLAFLISPFFSLCVSLSLCASLSCVCACAHMFMHVHWICSPLIWRFSTVENTLFHLLPHLLLAVKKARRKGREITSLCAQGDGRGSESSGDF